MKITKDYTMTRIEKALGIKNLKIKEEWGYGVLPESE